MHWVHQSSVRSGCISGHKIDRVFNSHSVQCKTLWVSCQYLQVLLSIHFITVGECIEVDTTYFISLFVLTYTFPLDLLYKRG